MKKRKGKPHNNIGIDYYRTLHICIKKSKIYIYNSFIVEFFFFYQLRNTQNEAGEIKKINK